MLGASRIRARGSDVLAEIPDKNVLEGQKCVRGKGETSRQEIEKVGGARAGAGHGGRTGASTTYYTLDCPRATIN